MDIFETVAEYVYRESLAILTFRDFLTAFVLFIIVQIVGYPVGKKKSTWNFKKTFFLSILVSYVYLVFMFAVFEREEPEYTTYKLMPFWSYYEIFFNDQKIMLLECLLNVVMFVPLGVCLAELDFKLRHTIFIGACMSYTIEFDQLFLHRGLFELVDDPFHNVSGAIIGYVFIYAINRNSGAKKHENHSYTYNLKNSKKSIDKIKKM